MTSNLLKEGLNVYVLYKRCSLFAVLKKFEYTKYLKGGSEILSKGVLSNEYVPKSIHVLLQGSDTFKSK